jgi:hypothetical protein
MGMPAKAFISQRYVIVDRFRDVLIALAKAIFCLEEEMKKPKVINLQAARIMRALIDELRRGKETLRESIATLLQHLHDIETACAAIREWNSSETRTGRLSPATRAWRVPKHSRLESLQEVG